MGWARDGVGLYGRMSRNAERVRRGVVTSHKIMAMSKVIN